MSRRRKTPLENLTYASMVGGDLAHSTSHSLKNFSRLATTRYYIGADGVPVKVTFDVGIDDAGLSIFIYEQRAIEAPSKPKAAKPTTLRPTSPTTGQLAPGTGMKDGA